MRALLATNLFCCALLFGCNLEPERAVDAVLTAEVQKFLDEYTSKYLGLYAETGEAEWALNTHIVEGDESNSRRYEEAKGKIAAFTGDVAVIQRTQAFLERKDQLPELQVRQLDAILFNAADNPQIVKETVSERIAAEAAQTEKLFGFEFRIDVNPVTTNDIDRILNESNDEAERLKAWEASKKVGIGLKSGLQNLVRLRNQTVQALGYEDYFQYQVSEYGMKVPEMMELMRKFLRETRPLFRELHTWARYELAKKYKAPTPDLIPAHWLPNRWGQDWSGMIHVEGFDLDAVLKAKSKEWMVEQAERFYVSLGFGELPATFWTKSSLYPLEPDAGYKKNNHASAWHMDLQQDVRSLMSVVPNAEWYETTHHELGHIYYYLSYAQPAVPPLLREGANRAFHEAVGSLLGLASMQKPFLQGLGLMPKDSKSDQIQMLLKEALNFIVFLPFSSGTMTFFEHDLYSQKLPVEEYNQRWWKYAAEFQGIVPPSPRGEEYCDAATKTHINDDSAQYYDYAISFILLHQMHAHIAKKLLKQDPRGTNYFGRKDVGKFLREILSLGATEDWRTVMRTYLGEEVSAQALLEYFAPLTDYLRAQNAGRKSTLRDA